MELRYCENCGEVVRTLLDHFEEIAPRAGLWEPSRDQLVEELARLGCRLVDAAAELAAEESLRGTPPAESSGIYALDASER